MPRSPSKEPKTNKKARKQPSRRQHRNFSVDQIAAALSRSGGLKSYAARSLGVTPGAMTQMIARHPELNQVIEEATESSIDMAEGNVMDHIVKRKSLTAAIFYLKYKGKARGYVEKSGADHDVTLHVRFEDTSSTNKLKEDQ